MEPLGRGDADPSPQDRLQEQEHSGPRQSLRGLLQFVRTAILGNQRDRPMSESGGNGGSSSAKAEGSESEAPTAAMSALAQRKRVVAQALAAANSKAQAKEQYEAGNDPRDNVPGLVIGPQKYLDPDLWRPPYDSYPEDSRERQAADAGHPIPLTQDRVLGRALGMVERLDREQA